MATKVFIDNNQNTAFIKRTGKIDPGELMRDLPKLETNPVFSHVRKVLSDTSGADFNNITNDEIEEHAKYCGSVLKKLKIAIVAPTDLSFGLSRMFEALSSYNDILITRDINEAAKWLEVDIPEF